jgi:hypothetical protein
MYSTVVWKVRLVAYIGRLPFDLFDLLSLHCSSIIDLIVIFSSLPSHPSKWPQMPSYTLLSPT